MGVGSSQRGGRGVIAGAGSDLRSSPSVLLSTPNPVACPSGRNNSPMLLRLTAVLATLTVASPAFAARCGGDFNSFLASMSADAQAAGISQGVVSAAFSGLTEDGAVLSFDRRQRYTFNKSFEQYVSTRVAPAASMAAGRCCSGTREYWLRPVASDLLFPRVRHDKTFILSFLFCCHSLFCRLSNFNLSFI